MKAPEASVDDQWKVFVDSAACVSEQVKAFERRCRHLYGASPTAKRKRAVEEAAAEAAGLADPCGGFLFAGEGQLERPLFFCSYVSLLLCFSHP